MIVYCFNLSAVLKSFFSLKPRFLFYTNFSGIINCDTFSVAPSAINKKIQKSVVSLNKFYFHFYFFPKSFLMNSFPDIIRQVNAEESDSHRSQHNLIKLFDQNKLDCFNQPHIKILV